MNCACQFLHKSLAARPRFRVGFSSEEVPSNGLYFLFEKGERSHGEDRIVRVGTHTGQNNLSKRLNEHLFAHNKDRSIFRKHVGRCLLSRESDSFLEFWDLDLTTKKQREKYGDLIDKNRLYEIENNVSGYINENFYFVVMSIEDKASRLSIEMEMLSTIAQCSECVPSVNWLGRFHPNRVIRECGLWNIQGMNGTSLTQEEMEMRLKAS